MKTANRSFLFILFMVAFVWAGGDRQFREHPGSRPFYLLTPLATAMSLKSASSGEENGRLQSVQATARWMGALTGFSISALHLYWMIRDDGATWRVLATAIPPILISTYVGMVATEWATNRILSGDPPPGKASLKGALYGAIDGTVILLASYLPLFLLGHYLDTIHFNTIQGNFMELKIIGVTLVGSIAYGGTIGLVTGAVAGPVMSVYLKF